MQNFAMASAIDNFNTVTVYVFVFFAVCGFFAILGKRLGWGLFRKRVFFPAFCAAALAALAVEATFFNFQSYLKIFAGPETQTMAISPDNPNVIQTTDGTLVEVLDIQNKNGIRFKGLDRKVTSAFVELNYTNCEQAEVHIQWTDEGGTRNCPKILYKHIPRENYVILQPVGKVSEIVALFSAPCETGRIDIISVALNKRIPFYFSGLRLLVITSLFFALISLLSKKVRAKTAYCLFEYKFNSANVKQNLIYASTVILLLLFSGINVYTSSPQTTSPHQQQYNKFLVDALIDGRTNLDYGNPEKLLEAKNPYDFVRLSAQYGYQINVNWMGDWAWYKGKYYCYYGVVPAIILYVPYKLITGNYLSNQAGIFLFTAIAVVLLAMLWRHCVKKYMPESRFAFYLLSFVTLFFASCTVAVLRHITFATIVQSAAFMFAAAGTLLLLKSIEDEKIKRVKLFLACLCFALIVGCRPNMIFVSLLVPAVLWKRRSWNLLLLVAIPYIMVAIPLCMYNYARFDSIFEFGQKYCLSIVIHRSANPIADFIKLYTSFAQYLFQPLKYSIFFPFIECLPQGRLITLGTVRYSYLGYGIINIPIVFCLFYMLKGIFRKDGKPPMFHLLSAFLIAAGAIMAVNSLFTGFEGRYAIDYSLFIILSALWCAYYWCNDNTSVHQPKTRMAVTYILIAASILVGLFLFVPGLSSISPQDPILYRYLEQSLGFVRYI